MNKLYIILYISIITPILGLTISSSSVEENNIKLSDDYYRVNFNPDGILPVFKDTLESCLESSPSPPLPLANRSLMYPTTHAKSFVHGFENLPRVSLDSSLDPWTPPWIPGVLPGRLTLLSPGNCGLCTHLASSRLYIFFLNVLLIVRSSLWHLLCAHDCIFAMLPVELRCALPLCI